MKLKNKKTGEIEEVAYGRLIVSFEDGAVKKVNSLAELNEEWEDYEDELLYVVSAEHRSGYQCVLKEEYPEICEVAKELGIGFETEKECQKAVECLRAWKRLKDKGFRFFDNKVIGEYGNVSYKLTYPATAVEEKDLDLLFGGEE